MQTMRGSLVGRPNAVSDVGPARLKPFNQPALHCFALDKEFETMQRVFQQSGGLVRGNEIVSIVASPKALNIGTLARWIVDGEVIHFNWQNDTWLPIFQFDSDDMVPTTVVVRVLKELAGVFDPWDTAQWFTRPCPSLAGRSPVEAIKFDPDLVLRAARCDRYVVDA